MLIRPVGGSPDKLAGFELVPPDDAGLVSAFTATQWTQWKSLPLEFTFEAVADKIVPRASLSRLVKRARSLGALDHDEKSGLFRKVGTIVV
jgi:hypothetical protein